MRCGNRQIGGSLILVIDGNLRQRGQRRLVLFLLIFDVTENRRRLSGWLEIGVRRHPLLGQSEPIEYCPAVKQRCDSRALT